MSKEKSFYSQGNSDRPELNMKQKHPVKHKGFNRYIAQICFIHTIKYGFLAIFKKWELHINALFLASLGKKEKKKS